MAALLAGEEAQFSGGGGMVEEQCVAMQYAGPQGPRVMSSKALAAAQEIVADDEEEEEEEDEDDEEEDEE